MSLIQAAFARKRTVWLMLVLLLMTGSQSFFNIPRESTPDIALPMLYISVTQEGMSTSDADSLLVEPIAQELEGLTGLKKVTSTGSHGHASLQLEFEAGTEIDAVLADVRERVDKAQPNLPADAKEPTVSEINMALFPVLAISLSGQIDERILTRIARDLRDRIESIPEVLEVTLAGSREEMLEITLPPQLMESHELQQENLITRIQRNHRVVTSGNIDTGVGHYSIEVPGLITNTNQIYTLPLRATETGTLLFKNIGNAERTFKDPTSLARTNGLPTINLEVKKRIGANIISAIEQTRALIDTLQPHWPPGIEVHYSQDQSVAIKDTLNDLTNNVVMATLLVMLVMLASLGLRSALLVSIAIPGAFLMAILLLNTLGYTLNMVVLFSLILAVGMLVDGAIVVTEYADRRLAEGLTRDAAYLEAAQRMAWPITASTATTLSAFMPLLFWPGTTGEFMKYMPITLLTTLSASLAMALIAIPVIGSNLGLQRQQTRQKQQLASGKEQPAPDNRVESDSSSKLTLSYLKLLRYALNRPLTVLLLACAVLIGSFSLYSTFGKGVEFFPDTDAEAISVTARGRGDLSIWEKDEFVKNIESILLRIPGLKTINTQVIGGQTAQETPKDTIGLIQAELHNWQHRAHADKIVAQIRQNTSAFPGLIIEVEKRKDGPAQGRAIQLILLGDDLVTLKESAKNIYERLRADKTLVDVRSTLPAPGIEWHYQVNRDIAARYSADIANIGSMIQMATKGVHVGDYRPGDTDEALDIIARYPKAYRTLSQLNSMRVATPQGLIPLSLFVERIAKPKVSQIKRRNGQYMYIVEANPAPGKITDNIVKTLLPEVQQLLPAGIEIQLGGDREQQAESGAFLISAFSIALFIMAIILVTQFNSFYQAALILSAVVFSTAGVLLGLLLKGEPFGIVMSGVGVIALAGIVVNNNIVLIDTYNVLKHGGLSPYDAALETCRQRLRPVLLTTITTVLGLLPMVFQVNIALLDQSISLAPPSAQWWTQLSSAIAGGLVFATVLTLFVTPAMLVLSHSPENRHRTHALE